MTASCTVGPAKSVTINLRAKTPPARLIAESRRRGPRTLNFVFINVGHVIIIIIVISSCVRVQHTRRIPRCPPRATVHTTIVGMSPAPTRVRFSGPRNVNGVLLRTKKRLNKRERAADWTVRNARDMWPGGGTEK